MNILFATDGSAESMAAARFLARLPLPSKPNVHVLAVIAESPSLDSFSTLDRLAISREEEQLQSQANLDRVSEVLHGVGFATQQHIKRDHPSRAILDTAEEMDADLIVIGAVGHNAVYRIVLGSTADYVANNARCSVLAVRPDSDSSIDNREFRVLLAYDESPYANVACREMFALKWAAELDSIHIAMMLGRPELLPNDIQYDAEAIHEAEQAVQMLRNSENCACEITYTVRETLHTGAALLDIAIEKNTNLLFVGPTGKSALSRFFLGSTSRYLLHHVDCSLWIAREKKPRSSEDEQ